LPLFNGIFVFSGWPLHATFRTIKRLSRKRHMPEQTYRFETEQETDGRWIAEFVDLPGVLAYGACKEEAIANAEALAFRVIADRIEETKVGTSRVSFAAN
jgi:predicted RNase H-like HicB family nuclease